MTIVLMTLALLFGADYTVRVVEPVAVAGMELNLDPIDPDAVVFRTGMTPPNLGD